MASSEPFLPTPKQLAAFQCPADDIFYGGAAAGGKTRFDFELANHICEEFPTARVAIFRRTTDELQFLKDKAREFLDPDRISINNNTGRITYHNGSVINLSHAHRREDIERHLTEEYALIIFDEAGTFIPYQISFARTRNRTPIKGLKPFLVLTSNPLGSGLVQLYKDFVEPDEYLIDQIIGYYPWSAADALFAEVSEYLDPAEDREPFKEAYITEANNRGIDWIRYEVGEREELVEQGLLTELPEPGTKRWGEMERIEWWRPKESDMSRMLGLEKDDAVRTRVFIPAWAQDNTAIPYQQYVGNIANDPNLSPAVKEALILGRWDVFEGQFFTDFQPKKNGEPWHVIDPIDEEDMDYGLHHWGSMDWGYSVESKLVVHWHYYDPELQQKITYDEIAVNQMVDEEVADLILAKNQHRPVRMFHADPQMWKGGAKTTTHADIFMRRGVPLERATNARVAGWSAVHSAMATNPMTGRPNWVVTSNCSYLIETLPTLQHDRNNPEDIEKGDEDHAADSLRYGLMAAPSMNQYMMTARAKAPSMGRIKSSLFNR